MFCPRCGSNQSEDLKFCKVCGANLYAVRQAVDARETDKKFDWGDWASETFRAGPEALKRKAEIERESGALQVKRYNEIKGGVIVGSIGIALAIFLNVFMDGIIMSGKAPPDSAPILSHLWIVGVIPLFIGIALIINGLFVSKRLVAIMRAAEQTRPNSLEHDTNPLPLRAADTTQFSSPGFSVTEETTKHLRGSR